ncbi:MAG: hypothetical protein IJP30_04340 [Clostridia bacterium]|nr:hypothetical protein [Clostridia bacterium]
MKRLVVLLVALALMFSLGAAKIPLTIANGSVEPPAGDYVFHAYIAEDDAGLALLEISYEDLMQHLKNNNLVFMTGDLDAGYEVLMWTADLGEDGAGSLHEMDSAMQKLVVQQLERMVSQEAGVSQVTVAMETLSRYPFVILKYRVADDNGVRFDCIYYTLINNIEYYFQVTGSRSIVTEEMEAAVRDSADSLFIADSTANTGHETPASKPASNTIGFDGAIGRGALRGALVGGSVGLIGALIKLFKKKKEK